MGVVIVGFEVDAAVSDDVILVSNEMVLVCIV